MAKIGGWRGRAHRLPSKANQTSKTIGFKRYNKIYRSPLKTAHPIASSMKGTQTKKDVFVNNIILINGPRGQRTRGLVGPKTWGTRGPGGPKHQGMK